MNELKAEYARITGFCPALDGSHVEVLRHEHPQVCISSYVHTATVLRFCGVPVSPGAWCIPECYLEWVTDISEDELGLDNPFGPVIGHEVWDDHGAVLKATRYLRAVHVNVRSGKRTVADQIFWGERGQDVWDSLQAAVARGGDPIDFVFEMKERV